MPRKRLTDGTVFRKFGWPATHGRAGSCRAQGAVLRAQTCHLIRKVTSKNNNLLPPAGPGVGRKGTRTLVPFARANGTNGSKGRGRAFRALREKRLRLPGFEMNGSEITDRYLLPSRGRLGYRLERVYGHVAQPPSAVWVPVPPVLLIPIFAWVKTPI